LRYNAARRSRNQSSADWESAVSRIGNPQTFADCQSAKQQIDNLRYEKSSRAATISRDTDRLAVCATNTTEALNRYSPPGEEEAGRSSGGDSCLWRRTRTLRVSAGWKPAPHDRQDACPTIRAGWKPALHDRQDACPTVRRF